MVTGGVPTRGDDAARPGQSQDWWIPQVIRIIYLTGGACLGLSAVFLIATDPTRWWAYISCVGAIVLVGVGLRSLPWTSPFWPDIALAEGERSVWQGRANLTRRGVARGGTLLLTDTRLIFDPNSFEAAFKLPRLEWRRSNVDRVTVARRGFSPLSGAWQRRLKITMDDGTSELFVISYVDSVQTTLTVELGRGDGLDHRSEAAP